MATRLRVRSWKSRQVQPALEEGRPARTVTLTDDERAIARNFFLFTTKPTIYAANVEEAALADPDSNRMVKAVVKLRRRKR